MILAGARDEQTGPTMAHTDSAPTDAADTSGRATNRWLLVAGALPLQLTLARYFDEEVVSNRRYEVNTGASTGRCSTTRCASPWGPWS